MSLISLIVVLIVIGVALWAIQQLPIDPAIRNIIRVLVIVFAVLWLLQALGLFSGMGSIRVN